MHGWTTLRLRATTPIFNGGAAPELRSDDTLTPSAEDNGETGVRVPSIRGAMRFWFRALAAAVTGPDLTLLAEVERHVFGGPEAPSPCVLRIPRSTNAPLRYGRDPDFFNGNNPTWVSYLLGLGLAEWDPVASRPRLLRPHVASGTKFRLMVRFNHARAATQDQRGAIEALAFASLWLTSAYGGIGARTHRGFGCFEIETAEGEIPPPWTAESFRTPALEHYEKIKNLSPTGEIADALRLLPALIPAQRGQATPSTAADWAQRPEFPVLSRTYTVAGLSRQGTTCLVELLERTGHKLRGFRTSDTHPSRTYRPQRGASTPEWNNMKEQTLREFPMSALGVPVNYTPQKPADGPSFVINLATGDHTPLRQSSKLWLHPVHGHSGDKNDWRLFSFGFLHSPAPNSDDHLYVWRDKSAAIELTTDPNDEEDLIRAWIHSPIDSI